MKIIIPSIGTRGDVQPYIALAIGLQAAGHTVTVATHPVWEPLVKSYQLSFAPIGPDVDIADETAKIRRQSPNWIVGFMRVMSFASRMVEQAHPDLLQVCQDADLVVVSHSAAGSMEADKLGLPTVSVTLQPQGIPANDPNASAFTRAVGKMLGAGMGMMMTRPFNQMRKRVGLPPLGATGITSPKLNLIPLSPHFFSANPLWEARHVMTGFWSTPAPQDWKPDASLQAFLDAGQPPVVVSLGAMALSGEDALEAATITLEAVQAAGVRAIIQGWDEPMKALDLPDTVLHAGSLPHKWLLPLCSGMVHHGGLGTTASAVEAGVSALVIPHIIDQFMWGNRVQELGVGPKPIARNKLSVENMTAALQQMQGVEMRQRAAALGEQIRSEPDGVARAVELIESNLEVN